MRNLITIVCLCVGFAMSAQIVNITYVTVPREESDKSTSSIYIYAMGIHL